MFLVQVSVATLTDYKLVTINNMVQSLVSSFPLRKPGLYVNNIMETHKRICNSCMTSINHSGAWWLLLMRMMCSFAAGNPSIPLSAIKNETHRHTVRNLNGACLDIEVSVMATLQVCYTKVFKFLCDQKLKMLKKITKAMHWGSGKCYIVLSYWIKDDVNMCNSSDQVHTYTHKL